MRMECGVEGNNKITCKDNADQRNSAAEVGLSMMRRSCSSDEVITTKHQGVAAANASTTKSSDGTSGAHSFVRDNISLDNNSVSFQNQSKDKTPSRMERNQADGVKSSFHHMRNKIPKHLMTESSSSNSSGPAVSCRSEIKQQQQQQSPKDLSVEAEPSSSMDEKDNNNKASWLNSVDSMALSQSDHHQAFKGGADNKKDYPMNGYGSRDECSNMSRLQQQQQQQQQFTTTKAAEEQSHESCLVKKRSEDVSMVSKSMEVASADSSHDVLGFDLNEDLDLNEGDNNPCHPTSSVEQPAPPRNVDVVINAKEPVAVMAKVAVPNGLPSAPLQFDGKLAWRSSPSKSAFRSTATNMLASNLNYSGRRNLKSSEKINSNNNDDSTTNTDHKFDLNIAAVSVDADSEFDSSAITMDICSGKSSAEARSPKKAPKLSLDLNCGGEGRHQSYLKLQMGGGFDLNENLSLNATETCADVYHQPVKNGNHHQQLRNSLSASSTTTSYREGRSPVPVPQFHTGLSSRPAYWVDVGSIPNFAQHLQAGQQSYVVDSGPNFLPPSAAASSLPRQGVVAPLQSKVAFAQAGPHPGFYVAAAAAAPPNMLPPSYYHPNMFAPWTNGQPGSANCSNNMRQLLQHHPPSTYQAGPPNIHVFESSSGNNNNNNHNHLSQGLYPNLGGQMGMMMGPGCYPYNGTGMVSSDKEGSNIRNASERTFIGLGNQEQLHPQHIGERTHIPQYMGASPPSAASAKRREPGGGWDSFQQQLNSRRMTAWK